VKIYADSSALFAWFYPGDRFSQNVVDWCHTRSPQFCWNLVLRIEVRHNLRKFSGRYASAAWHSYRASEASRRLQLDSDRLSDLLERGDELSARHAQASPAGVWDFVHVAAAQYARAEIFITCDAAQAKLARLAGVTRIHLFE
jgi:predicted nucleic acid-binding protein